MSHTHFYNRRIAVTGSGGRVKRYCACGDLGPWTQHPNRQAPTITVSSLLLKTKAELIELSKKVDHSKQPQGRFNWNTKTTKDVMVNDLLAAYGI